MNSDQHVCGHDNQLSRFGLKFQIIRIFFISTSFILVVVGLLPFSFWTENGVRRLIQIGGIEFYNRGIVFSGGPLNDENIGSPTGTIDAVSIEIWLKPDKEPFTRAPAFLCFNDNKRPPPVFLRAV